MKLRFMKRVEPFGVPVIAEVILVKAAGMAHFINKYLKIHHSIAHVTREQLHNLYNHNGARIEKCKMKEGIIRTPIKLI